MTEMEKRAYMKKYREKVKKMNRAQLAEEWERVTGILKPGGSETEKEEEQESVGRLIERKGRAWRLKGVPWIELQENARITKETAQKIYGALAKLKGYEEGDLMEENVRAKLEAIRIYQAEGLTPDEIRGLKERNEPMEPEITGRNSGVGCLVGTCPRCGETLRSYMKFCNECGQRLWWEEK